MRDRLTAAQVRDVLGLAADAAAADGVDPFSEHVGLHLRHGGDTGVRHVLIAEPDSDLVGYAHVDLTDRVDGPSGELVVRPARRGLGHGRRLVTATVEAAEEATGDRRLRLWAHGGHPAAAVLAAALGFVPARVLWQMRRSSATPLPPVELPPGVRLRSFVVGRDSEAWLRVNARAFAGHPEQGRWTDEDLAERIAEPWFDPAGFLLAVDADDRLLGFHWTKVHGGHTDTVSGALGAEDGHGHDPIGEVYVVGVDPDARGLHLGGALTLAGLHHLRDRGLADVLLYVDESNVRAVRLYERLGFARWSVDVGFRRT